MTELERIIKGLKESRKEELLNEPIFYMDDLIEYLSFIAYCDVPENAKQHINVIIETGEEISECFDNNWSSACSILVQIRRLLEVANDTANYIKSTIDSSDIPDRVIINEECGGIIPVREIVDDYKKWKDKFYTTNDYDFECDKKVTEKIKEKYIK